MEKTDPIHNGSPVQAPALEPAAADKPAAVATDPALMTPRGRDVAIKHQRIVEFLEDEGYDAVLLSRPDSFAWFTAGGNNGATPWPDATEPSLFVTPEHRCVLAHNADSARIFEEEVAGLGFQLKECRWYEPPHRLLADICRARRVASDTGLCGTANELAKLRRLRVNLTELEQQRFRQLGRDLSHAVEATCRNAEPGKTENELAGELAHRLLRHGIEPAQVRLAADGRGQRLRLPLHKPRPVRRWFTITATGRQHGLCASLTRTVFFGRIEPDLVGPIEHCAMVDATCIFFSRHDEPAAEVLRRARRIYEKTGTPHEWLRTPQGAVTGYSTCEVPVVPDNPFRFRSGMAVCWSPSVGPIRSGDTMLITDAGYEILTTTIQWPQITISVRGVEVDRPAPLVRV